MRILFILTTSLTLLFSCQQDHKQDLDKNKEVLDSNYDQELANELKADDYGMAKYVMAFLKRGPNRPQDSTKRAELQSAHLENITRLAKAGKLVLAGPFLDDGNVRGIYIFDVQTIEEAEALTATDPAILFGSLEMELHPWYGSAGVKKIGEIHDKISKVKI